MINSLVKCATKKTTQMVFKKAAGTFVKSVAPVVAKEIIVNVFDLDRGTVSTYSDGIDDGVVLDVYM